MIQADATIREIFASLEEKGYLSNSVVAILADHGEGLGERGKSNYGHVLSLYQEFINIPLLFYDQEEVRYANTEFATQIDVAPTLVDRLGLPIPSSWEGRSLLDPGIRQYSFHQTRLENPCYAVLSRTDQGIYKYMTWAGGNREALFELTGDPREKNDLKLTADAGLMEEMRKKVEEELSRRRPWADALTAANSLANGYCGLSDGSAAGDWRLPSVDELWSLVDLAFYDPAISNAQGDAKWTTDSDAFSQVQSCHYWSSTTYADGTTSKWVVSFRGYSVYNTASSTCPIGIWPVRGGQ